jgi:hypothetical protein
METRVVLVGVALVEHTVEQGHLCILFLVLEDIAF